jgi:hypothetical protein
VHRRHLETALASLGLLAPGCHAPASGAEPPASHTAPPDAEPSGLGEAPKSASPSSPGSGRSRFEALPIEFCGTRFEDPQLPLRRTSSFLEAWNELAPPVHNRLALDIPHAELDARRQLCGDERCTVETSRVATVQVDYLVGVGALIPDADALLVVPDLARDHGASRCSDTTELAVAQHGSLLHLSTTTEQRRFNYGHYSGHDGEQAIPLDCYSYATVRRDLVIDLDHDTLVLVLEQSRTTGDAQPWTLPRFEPPGIRLSGCDGVLELRWTGSAPAG